MKNEDKKILFAGILLGTFAGILGGLVINSFFAIMQITGALNLLTIFMIYLNSILGIIILVKWMTNQTF